MGPERSGALVCFGATGDLAYKQIFPALQAMVRRGHLDVPVVGVARAGWGLEQFRVRARDSLEHHGGVDEAAFARLSSLLRYVDGDYGDPSTFERLRDALKGTERPCTTSPSRRACSRRSPRASHGPAARRMPEWSSRSRSAATSPRPRS